MTHYKNRTGNLAISLSLVCTMLISCKKFLEIPPPQTQAQTKKIFENDQAAVSALTGLYNQMLTNNLWLANGGITVYTGLSADELFNTSTGSATDGFTKNELLPDNEILMASFWIPAYKAIYHANALLDGLSNSTALSLAISNQVKGEALAVRAFHYFYLINLFGDSPLLTTTSYELNSKSPRTPSDEIYTQLLADLELAKTLLPVDYPSPGKARPNRFTVLALLARVYLYQQQWTKAEANATEIIESGKYELVQDIDQSFLMDSQEAIWQLVIDNYNTAEGAAFIPALSFFKPAYALTPSLFNAFEPNDTRKQKWLKLSTAGGQENFYPFKYKMRAASPVLEYYTVFRLAEQYLIRGEARANMDDIAGAQSDLNTIRNRAGLPNTLANDKQSLLIAIEQERRIELFAEWGHRWFDLKRTSRADAVLLTIKAPNWQATDTLYPIPLNEIKANPFLTQNPGY